MINDTLHRLTAISLELASIKKQLDASFDAIAGEPTLYIAPAFKQLSDGYEKFKDAKESLTELRDRVSRDIFPEAFRRDKLKGRLNIEGVGGFQLGNRFSCSMIDKEAGYQWLRDNGNASLIQETVNASSLAAFAKNMIEEEGKELPSDIFKTSIMTYTSITKA